MAEFARAFITGSPVDRSLSPYIHHYWLQFYNLKGSYEAVSTSEESFPRFLANIGQKGFCGGNIAAPHKEAALALVARPTVEAASLGAVNMVWLEDGLLCGDNSNWQGFIANLDEYAAGWPGKTALILGAGPFIRAVIYALLQRGFTRLVLAGSTREPLKALADFFQSKTKARIEICALTNVNEVLPQAGLLVNTGGLAPAAASLFAGAMGDSPGQAEEAGIEPKPFDFMDFSRVKPGTIAAESVAQALPTPFLRAAAAAGLKTVDGLGMLLHQAAFGFERWFGQRPLVSPELRNYIAGIAARTSG
ncbi:MAG: shikimate dehydrogenase [Candidatus Tokpelaia sp.]|nr:MAG: shikimate dehydrogenase [Candidatus Tokpelaia sp.]KAA6206824.1 MAG: shikimate dehydrogenase [Candidatus Tokpelaia sp.]